ncbi:TonB family protein [Oleiharenicola lentus]|uniref:TonB family protein n=1 Tax=Oleiharenicola lentus TaxID=2508720 RepID=A0A4Q1C6F0_9BACT|nr:energy transducer TonB [Oleiharenicola lentus]RXK54444.1 TonB family protein [Oleiharenicola lentus]
MTVSRPFKTTLLLVSLALAAFADDRIVPVKELIEKGTLPRPIKREAPPYPTNMERSRLEGLVEVSFVINTEGHVVNPVVMRSNNPWFERPAIEAILKWRFHPGEMDGKKVNALARQRLEFTLDDGDTPAGLWYVPRLKNPEELPPELRWTTAPQPVTTAFPVYPFEVLQAGKSGVSEIKFIIGPDGRVSASQVLQAGLPELGLAAQAMIDTWRFTPPKNQEGQPCYAALTMRHDFRPNNYGNVPLTEEALTILKKLEKKPGDIVPSNQLDAMPKPLSRRPPVYPSALRRKGQPGEAVIEFFIAPNGDAELPRIVSSTLPEFGYAAAQAVATWRFEPPRRAGKPVITRVRIPIEFTHETAPASTNEAPPENLPTPDQTP